MALKKKKTTGTEAKKRASSNLLALDFATTGVKAIRLKKIKDRMTLTAADILPAVGLNTDTRPDLPKSLSTYYAALCATIEDASLRVFNQVLPDDFNVETVCRENLSVDDSRRVSGMILSRAKGKKDSTLLGVSVPEKTIQNYLSIFSSGAPALRSIELAGLSAFSAFLYNFGEKTANQTVCLIEAGASCTYVAFLYRNQLQVVNRFDIGSEALQRQVQLSLGVDAEMAETILTGGSVDVSTPVRHVFAPFAKQLAIYREFVERQNKNPLSAVYISGGMATSPFWQKSIKDVLGFVPETWSPFEKIDVPDGVFPEQFNGQESRFAAAVGAALSGMEAA